MQTVFPSYYLDFRCIGGACKHSCCVDWEIDIDPQTYRSYLSRTDALGARIRASVAVGDNAHFCLNRDGRCPFLNKDNLCDIITEVGEGALPEICREHPRFRNGYGDACVELGLGFACEEALSCALREEKLSFLCLDGEIDSLTRIRMDDVKPLDASFPELLGYNGDFLREKHRVLLALSDVGISPKERILRLCKEYGIDTSSEMYLTFFSTLATLEQLEPQWGELIACAKEDQDFEIMISERFVRLLSLFIFRHATADSLYSLATVMTFAFHLCRLAEHLHHGREAQYPYAEIVRLLSSEIEYSEDNTEALLDACEALIL